MPSQNIKQNKDKYFETQKQSVRAVIIKNNDPTPVVENVEVHSRDSQRHGCYLL